MQHLCMWLDKFSPGCPRGGARSAGHGCVEAPRKASVPSGLSPLPAADGQLHGFLRDLKSLLIRVDRRTPAVLKGKACSANIMI